MASSTGSKSHTSLPINSLSKGLANDHPRSKSRGVTPAGPGVVSKMYSTMPSSSDHSCGRALQTSCTNNPKTFCDSWWSRSVLPISHGRSGPLKRWRSPSNTQNSFISVLLNSWPLSDLNILGMVRLLNMSLENALLTSNWESAWHGSNITALEMQHTYDSTNRFPCPSSCIGPSKSTATSSQHWSQLGFTATDSCFPGL